MEKASGNIVLLAGGTGGAKMAEGLAASRYGDGLTVVGNIGDDHEFHGLWVSPDMDTLLYTLADVIDRDKGWGVAGDSFHTLEALQRLGVDTWMLLGDRDFATHILRTQLLHDGVRATQIAQTLATRLGVTTPILPPSDTPVRTRVQTDDGWLAFQEYFVRERCRPTVRDVEFDGVQQARATPEVVRAIGDADLIVLAPSNPVVSIDPILAVPGVTQALRASRARKVAVSPLVAGQALKGPADRMLQSFGYSVDPLGIADFYEDSIDALVIDHADAGFAASLNQRGLAVLAEDIVMRNHADKVRLAEAVVKHFLSTVSDAGDNRVATCPST